MIGSKLLTVGVAGLLGFGISGPMSGTPDASFTVARASILGTDAITAPADTTYVKLAIEGMTCGSCATTARVVLERTDGVIDADVSYEKSTAEVTYDADVTTPVEFIARLKEMTGYEARVAAEDEEVSDAG